MLHRYKKNEDFRIATGKTISKQCNNLLLSPSGGLCNLIKNFQFSFCLFEL